MSLNEIVNAPNEFVSSSPHLVVAQLDWIQTRYLFVKCSTSASVTRPEATTRPKAEHAQDPAYTPSGENGRIVIPATPSKTVQMAKRKVVTGVKPLPKAAKRPRIRGTESDANKFDEDNDANDDAEDDDNRSDVTDEEDTALLKDETAPDSGSRDGFTPHPRPESLVPRSSFVPGLLDYSTLPKMPEPCYANTSTTRRLQGDLKAVLKVQGKHAAAELGWYIDAERIDNFYQWIVELHSFEAFRDNGQDIPLVDDMKKFGVNSIVLELRFSGSYPMSPPFVRVVSPRFLGFQQGGGGHVTAGGALCMEVRCESCTRLSWEPRLTHLFPSFSQTAAGVQCPRSSQCCCKYDWLSPRRTRSPRVCNQRVNMGSARLSRHTSERA